MDNIGAVILAGGGSRRMGKDKALLTLDDETFLGIIAAQLDDFDEILLSVGCKQKYTGNDFVAIQDLYPDIGPVGGIYSALNACRSGWLLTVSCDMPFFPRGLAKYMCAFVSSEYDAFVLTDRDGRVQPLCAIYAKSALPILEAQISVGDYRVIAALNKMRVKQIPLQHSAYSDDTILNINTPALYSAIAPPPIIAVCGVKNSGKTTLLEGVLPILARRGLRVAVVKHDGHDFEPDVPGRDSHRLKVAGAVGVGIYSSNRYMLTAEQTNTDPEFFRSFFVGADIILLEGGKNSIYPKIEIVRGEVSQESVSKTPFALCTDLDIQLPGVISLPIDDFDGIAEAITAQLRKKSTFA